MGEQTGDELQAVLRPITSLISKSEKAQQKVAPGTWQHTMMRDNVRALRIASELLTRSADAAASFSDDELRAAVDAVDSMIGRTENSQVKFSPGTSQHTLQRNRLRALRAARAALAAELDGPNLGSARGTHG